MLPNNRFLNHYKPFFFFLVFIKIFVLKSILSGFTIATSALFWLLFSWYIILYPLISNLFVSLNLKDVSNIQHIHLSYVIFCLSYFLMVALGININLILIVRSDFNPLLIHYFSLFCAIVIKITFLYIVWPSTQIIKYVLYSYFKNQMEKSHKQKNTFTLFYIYLYSYIYWYSLFLHVHSSYCVRSFHFSMKDSL